MSKSNSLKKNTIVYSIWILGFLVLSLGLGYFRATDHGRFPNYSDAIPIQNEEAYNFGNANSMNRISIHYFWATWCNVCKMNDPFLKANLSMLNDQRIDFKSWEEGSLTPEKLKDFIINNNIDYPVAIATPRFLQESKITGFPTTVFVDSNGIVRFVDPGIMNPFSFWIRIILLKLF